MQLPNGVELAFCPTGPGGGVDNSCSPTGEDVFSRMTEAELQQAREKLAGLTAQAEAAISRLPQATQEQAAVAQEIINENATTEAETIPVVPVALNEMQNPNEQGLEAMMLNLQRSNEILMERRAAMRANPEDQELRRLYNEAERETRAQLNLVNESRAAMGLQPVTPTGRIQRRAPRTTQQEQEEREATVQELHDSADGGEGDAIARQVEQEFAEELSADAETFTPDYQASLDRRMAARRVELRRAERLAASTPGGAQANETLQRARDAANAQVDMDIRELDNMTEEQYVNRLRVAGTFPVDSMSAEALTRQRALDRAALEASRDELTQANYERFSVENAASLERSRNQGVSFRSQAEYQIDEDIRTQMSAIRRFAPSALRQRMIDRGYPDHEVAAMSILDMERLEEQRLQNEREGRVTLREAELARAGSTLPSGVEATPVEALEQLAGRAGSTAAAARELATPEAERIARQYEGEEWLDRTRQTVRNADDAEIRRLIENTHRSYSGADLRERLIAIGDPRALAEYDAFQARGFRPTATATTEVPPEERTYSDPREQRFWQTRRAVPFLPPLTRVPAVRGNIQTYVNDHSDNIPYILDYTPGNQTKNAWVRTDQARDYGSKDYWSYRFNTSSGNGYNVTISERTDNGDAYLMFTDNSGSTEVTGAGMEHEVFKHVSASVVSYLDRMQPREIKFTAAESSLRPTAEYPDVRDLPPEIAARQRASRQDAYRLLAKTFTKLRPDYELEEPYTGEFHVKKKRR